MEKAKIDAQFSAGIQQITEAYQNMRRTPHGELTDREKQLMGKVSELTKENEELKFMVAQMRRILGTEESHAYTRTDPRYELSDTGGPATGLPNSTPWGERR